MKNLDRWIAAYKAMDQRRRDENLDLAEADAIAHPAVRGPVLRLVANGAALHNLGDAVGSAKDLLPTVIVRPVK